MKTLRVGIIGSGNMGRRHARAYAHHARAELVACCDIVPCAAQSLADEFGCTAETTFDAMLARDDIEAISICTIEPAHLDAVLKTAAAGKHILLEKPMAMNMDEALEMKHAVEDGGIKFMVAHLFRFDQRCAETKQVIASGKIGEVVSVNCRFHGTPHQQDRIKNSELSIFVFRGCHGIDLMRWYTGSEVVRVYAESLDGQLRRGGYQSEDAVFCLMRFASGAVGSIEVNSHVPAGHPTAGQSSMTVIGAKGMVEQDLNTPWLTVSDGNGIVHSQGNQKDLWFREEVDAFVHHVLDNGPNIATSSDGIAALEISLAAVKSARTNQPVDVFT